MTTSGLLESQQISALGNMTKVHTDGHGRVIEQVDALNNVSAAQYDNNGNLLSSRDPNGVGQDCIYDQQNRRVQCTDTAGISTTAKYSVGGLVLNQQDGKGIFGAKDATYDARGRMTSKTTKLDNTDTTTFTYDANGNRLTITDAEGKQTRYAYDNRNLKTAWTFPGQTSTIVGAPGYDTVQYEYDAAARLVAFLRQDGTRDENTYAFNGTLTQKQFKNALGTVSSTDSFVYDLNNRLVQAIKGRYNNTVQLAYDAIGRKASETLLLGTPGNSTASYTTQYGYDADNRNTSITYPDGKVVARTYTQRNQLQSASFDGQNIATGLTYDNGGREISRTLGNGVQQTRAYRADGLLSGLTTAGDAGSSVSYGYDQNKNLTAETFGGALANFSTQLAQDAKDRLTQFTRTNGDTANWTLTKEGDWTQVATTVNGTSATETRTHNDNHQITQINGTIIPTYDAQGDLATDEQGRAYFWDQEKQLAGIIGGTTNVGFAYDAMGRRVSKTSGGTTTVYVSSGSQEIAEYANGSLTKEHVYGTYVDEDIATQDSASGWQYRVMDRRYSTTALLDAAGAVIERYVYTAYGKTTVLDANGVVKSSAPMTEILWTGRRLDAESGVYYFRSRYFSATLGRFISRDVDYLDGENLYEGYFEEDAGNDPFGYADYDFDNQGGFHVRDMVGNKEVTYSVRFTDTHNFDIVPKGNHPLSDKEMREARRMFTGYLADADELNKMRSRVAQRFDQYQAILGDRGARIRVTGRSLRALGQRARVTAGTIGLIAIIAAATLSSNVAMADEATQERMAQQGMSGVGISGITSIYIILAQMIADGEKLDLSPVGNTPVQQEARFQIFRTSPRIAAIGIYPLILHFEERSSSGVWLDGALCSERCWKIFYWKGRPYYKIEVDCSTREEIGELQELK